MKKIISFIIIGIILLTLVGCAKVTNTDTTVVEGTVIRTQHISARIVPMKAGKVTTFVRHPEKNYVHIQYNDITISVNDSELYDYYKDHIGETIECNLITDYYDNGETKTRLEVRGDEYEFIKD